MPQNAEVTNGSVWVICIAVCVCVPWEEAVQHSPMLQGLNREWENVLTTAVNEEKKEKRGGKRSAVKVAEAHKRKERDRKSLLSLIRVSASLSPFGEPKHEPTLFPSSCLFCSYQNFLSSNYTCTLFSFVIFYVPSVIQFVSQKDRVV